MAVKCGLPVKWPARRWLAAARRRAPLPVTAITGKAAFRALNGFSAAACAIVYPAFGNVTALTGAIGHRLARESHFSPVVPSLSDSRQPDKAPHGAPVACEAGYRLGTLASLSKRPGWHPRQLNA